mmetsp:Transcript_19090/g.26708  ORF Transcript_19090/g.26708 Transcript_19090/m.26708 type:complete len:233 (-) Transcript_19090:122-820(-)
MVRVDGLNRVNSSSVVVVDRLLDSASLLESLKLVSHELEVVSADIKSGDTSILTASTVKGVEVIEADGGDELTGGGVSLGGSSSEDGVYAAKESRLSASRVSSNTEDNRALNVLLSHHRRNFVRDSSVLVYLAHTSIDIMAVGRGPGHGILGGSNRSVKGNSSNCSLALSRSGGLAVEGSGGSATASHGELLLSHANAWSLDTGSYSSSNVSIGSWHVADKCADKGNVSNYG